MNITRNTIAILLETKPNNVKSFKQVDNEIYIKLGDSDDELSMTLQEYQSCLDRLRRNKGHIDCNSFLTIGVVIGVFVYVAIASTNANIVSNDSVNTQTSSQLP